MSDPHGPEHRWKVAILHGFSRRNAGDGLLVDLTYEALGQAGIAQDECLLLALDPESFPERPHVARAPGEPTAQPSLKLIGAAGEMLASGLGLGRLPALLARAHGLVAVGGGYLVADSPVRQAGVILNHLAQIRAAARHAGPTVYLPQSIGPLQGPAGWLTRKALAGVDRIWARDDETMAEIALPNMARCPDLAVMKLGRSLAPASGNPASGAMVQGPVVLVGRDLPRAPGLAQAMRALGEALPGACWAVQADMTGPRSDRAFYQRIGLADAGSLEQLLEGPTGPVVSARLHGAITALLAGRPAIHLAYERKGWGAYEDLGLIEYVHDARAFDPALVAAQVRALQADPAPFWEKVQTARSRLAAAWDTMVADLAGRFAAPR